MECTTKASGAMTRCTELALCSSPQANPTISDSGSMAISTGTASFSTILSRPLRVVLTMAISMRSAVSGVATRVSLNKTKSTGREC